MCTAFVRKGKDLLFGFNLDIDPEVWDYALYKNDKIFTVGIRVGKTLYYTHGVNREGHFGNVPYMNGNASKKKSGTGRSRVRIDLLTDRYLRNKYSYDDVLEILRTKNVLSIPDIPMHSLLADADGNMVLVEPGYGYCRIAGPYAVVTNFSLLARPESYEPYFGEERFDRALEILIASDRGFTAADGLALLREVRQEGQWATRISFVYSARGNCVYYVMNNDFGHVQTHRFR